MGDPYAVLGLHRSATTEEVRAAFRRAALKFHPDRHVGEGPEAVSRASQQFNDVVRAYEWLTDPKRQRPGQGGGGGGGRHSSEWGRATQHSTGWRDAAGASGGQQQYSYTAWRGTDMAGNSTATHEGAAWGVRGMLARRMTGAMMAGGLVLLFLTTQSPVSWLWPTPSLDAPSGRAASASAAGTGGPAFTPHSGPHRPTPHRLSRAEARALGLSPPPVMALGRRNSAARSEAHARWTATQADSAEHAAAAAEADAQRAAEAAANAQAAAKRAREAALRIAASASSDASAPALSPGQIAAAATEAVSAYDRARRSRQAAEYSAACALVAAGPGEETAPDIAYGAGVPAPGGGGTRSSAAEAAR